MNERFEFDLKLINWHQNKIKGGIAEACCRTHFEALGFAVESTGIEHIAPLFCRLNQFLPGSYIENVREMQNLPDFIISRVHPKTSINIARNRAGKADAVLIEAKFRTEVVLEDFTKELLETYRSILDKKIHFIVYLVCKRYKLKRSSQTFINDSHVFLNFFNPDKSLTNGDTGWRKAGEWDGFEKFPLYQGWQDGQDFNQAYREIVHPVLAEMLS